MKQFYIGLDLGGTYLRAVACDKGGFSLSDIKKEPLVRKENLNSEIEENLIKLIDCVCIEQKKEGKELAGIGISMAALFNRNTGTITNWPNNKKWDGFPIGKCLMERYLVPIVMEDDANAAVLGEQLAGAGRGLSNFIYVTISTGIGSGILMNNSILTGCHGWAGELGHIRVSDENVTCTCGAKGCLQAIASGPAILKSFEKTKAYETYCQESDINLEVVVALAEQGVKEAVDVYCTAGRYIGSTLANLIILLDIPSIILGGGVMNAGKLIMEPIMEGLQNSLQNKRNARIVCSSLNDKNGVIGALALIDKYVNGINTISLVWQGDELHA